VYVHPLSHHCGVLFHQKVATCQFQVDGGDALIQFLFYLFMHVLNMIMHVTSSNIGITLQIR
jgi:hypothetical protein